MKKKVVYTVHTIIILAAAFFVCLQRGLFGADNAREVFHILSDAFLVPAVFYIGISLLGLAASKGTYDMFGFAFGSLFSRFIPGMNREKYKGFYEYKREIEEKKRMWNPCMLFCGLAALMAAVLFLILYAAC